MRIPPLRTRTRAAHSSWCARDRWHVGCTVPRTARASSGVRLSKQTHTPVAASDPSLGVHGERHSRSLGHAALGLGTQNSGPYRAQPPVDDRTAPDSAGLDEDQPLAVFGLVRG